MIETVGAHLSAEFGTGKLAWQKNLEKSNMDRFFSAIGEERPVRADLLEKKYNLNTAMLLKERCGISFWILPEQKKNLCGILKLLLKKG